MTQTNTTQKLELVGDRIRQAREAAGISVRELARRVEVSASHVSQVERGLASFSVRSLRKVVSILGVSMDSLFEGTMMPTVVNLLGAPDGLEVAAEDGLLDEARIGLRLTSRPAFKMQSGPSWGGLTATPTLADELEKLARLRDRGVLTDEEFAASKAKILG